MVKIDPPPTPPLPAPAHDNRPVAGDPVERGWFLSSFDLASGLRVVEADDEELRSLFGTLQAQ